MQEFNAARFELQVNNALTAAQRILDNTRALKLPSDVSHAYEDKYLLAEFSTNTALAGVLACLVALGLEASQVKKLQEWATTRSVTVQFSTKETCVFEKEHKYDVDSSSSSVLMRGVDKIFHHKTVTTITEYWWQYRCTWELSVFPGTDTKAAIVFSRRKGKALVKTSTKQTPHPAARVLPPITLNISFLLKYLSPDGGAPFFFIDRTSADCHTPSRNPQITAARNYFDHVHAWGTAIRNFFTSTIFVVNSDHALNVGQLSHTNSIFCPLVPLFDPILREEKSSTSALTAKRGTGVVLALQDMNAFLAEQKRSISERFAVLAKEYPEGKSSSGGKALQAIKEKVKTNPPLISVLEAQLVTILTHTLHSSQFFSDVVDYIERLLYRQIIAAVGQEVSPSGFAEYIAYHNRSLLKPEYLPQIFAYSIRRVEHDPEGALSIEENNQPIATMTKHQFAETPMGFHINAATKIQFFGSRYVHACVRHQFAGDAGPELRIKARARQFSSFILVLGKVLSMEDFHPTHAIIIRDKDDLAIPLALETIPSAKEFAAAVQSLSPEQLRFAKAYRSMQLSSTLFGLCVLQIKPQLERLLNLNRDSLTKEIELSQHLMELFIKYQIPSDLLSFGGKENVTVRCKLKRVRTSVDKARAMISRAEKLELREAIQTNLKNSFLDDSTGSESASDSSSESCGEGGVCDEDEDDNDDDDCDEAPARPLSSRSPAAQIQQQARQQGGTKSAAAASSTSKAVSAAASSAPKAVSKDMAAAPSASKNMAPPKPVSGGKSAPAAKIAPAPAASKKEVAPSRKEKEKEEKQRDEAPMMKRRRAMSAEKEMAQSEECEEELRCELDMMCEDLEERKEQYFEEPIPEPIQVVEEDLSEPPDELQSEDEEDASYQPPVIFHPSTDAKPLVDFTKIPTVLDTQLSTLDPDGALRPTILNTGSVWAKTSQAGLLGSPVVSTLMDEEQKKEKNEAFDLLDALTRSGALPFLDASLHVVVCSTHCFDETVMHCLVKKNINPIEKVERSTLIVGSVIHNTSPETLVKSNQLERVKTFCPTLFSLK